MAVFYRFKSSTELGSIPIDGPFITVGALKEEILEKMTRGKCDLVVINPLTNEDYVDERSLIHRCSTVLIRRVPRQILLPIVIPPVPKPGDDRPENESTRKSEEDSTAVFYPEDLEWDEFAKEWCPISDSDSFQGQSALGNHVRDRGAPPATVGGGGELGVPKSMTPYPGYVCNRCKIPGHFIQNCPTNSDRSYDSKRLKRPTGIPKSMLMDSRDGSYSLPSGAVAVLKPNEAAFKKEIEGIPSKNSSVDLPPELHCPLCKHAMKDAVFASNCCFESFCDRCIREHIITKSMCVCGATDVLADHLLPNMTLRDTINRMLESDYGNSSHGSCGRNSKSSSQTQHTASSNSQSQPSKFPSTTHSVASKRDHTAPPNQKEETEKMQRVVEQTETANTLKKTRLAKDVCASETKNQQGIVPSTKTVQPLVASGEEATKKKRKRNAADWASAEAENYMMTMAAVPAAYNPYLTGMNSFTPHYVGVGPWNNVPFGGVFPNHPFGFGQQGGMMMMMPAQSNYARPPLVRENQMKRNRVREGFGDSQNFPKDQDCCMMPA